MDSPYHNAQYYIDGFNKPILIGEISDELEAYLQKENVNTWAFITAYNPMSIVQHPQKNKIRNRQLKEKIKGYHFLEGEGRDPSGEWIPERSFLIMNISAEDARVLATEFGQKAILYGKKGNVAELIELEN